MDSSSDNCKEIADEMIWTFLGRETQGETAQQNAIRINYIKLKTDN